MPKHQVLIVGGGLAGLRAALAAQEAGLDTALVSRVYPVRSHSGAAQGGVNVPLGNAPAGKDDSPDVHAFDTVKGGDYLADQDAVLTMTTEAAQRIYEMEHWGCPFSRMEDGRLAQRPFGGAGYPRTVYAADKTGHYMLHTIYEQSVKRSLKVYSEMAVLALAVSGGECHGVVALDIPTGDLVPFQAEAVVFATGGAGRVYARSTNAIINTGSGMAVAYWAGVPLEDLEFMQFHPTTLWGTNILISEGARGEGGYLINALGERYMRRYAPDRMELAPRDIVARATQTEINEGRGFQDAYIHLDLRHLGLRRIQEGLPGIREFSISFAGVDPVSEPIPIQPGQHYTMGGIACNIHGETVLPGFFACGECGCVSVHGANRLGGNSLLETLVFGKLAGERAAQFVKGRAKPSQEQPVAEAQSRARDKVQRLLGQEGRENFADLRDQMRQTMFNEVGLFREGKAMAEGLARVRDLKERYRHAALSYKGSRFNLDLAQALELEATLDLAEVMAACALAREESRGSHYRVDYKERDDKNWLKHSMAAYSERGPQLSYKGVTITRWQPAARAY